MNRVGVVLLVLLANFGIFSQGKLELGLCDDLPEDLYKMKLDSLIIQNGMGYCQSPEKVLSSKLKRMKTLTYLSYQHDFFKGSEFNQLLPSEVGGMNLRTLVTNVPNQEVFEMEKLHSLSLSNIYNVELLEKNGLKNLTYLRSFSVILPEDRTISIPGIKEHKHLEEVDISNPNQKILDDILSITHLKKLKLSYAKGLRIDLSRCDSLQELEITGIDIDRLPLSLYNLKKLNKLVIKRTNVDTIPNEISKLTNLKFLDLSDNKIRFVSSEISSLSELKILTLRGNKELAELNVRKNCLGKLRVLNLSDCSLKEEPRFIDNLKNLQEAFFNNNELTSFALDLSKLISLKTLDLQKNKIRFIHPSLMSLPSLTKLNISNNQLTKLSHTMREMIALEEFRAHNNQLTFLPSDIGLCNNLNTVSVYQNKIKALPPTLFQLEKLIILHVGNNLLKSFPKTLDKAIALHTFEIQNNPFTKFPEAIFELPSLDRVWVSSKQTQLKGFRKSEKNPMVIITN